MEINQYMEQVPVERRKRIMMIMEIIREMYPTREEKIWYSMPTFKYQDGWISVANQKNYISIYTCDEEFIKEFKEKNPEIKTGKCCLNFRDKDVLHEEDLKIVIKKAMEAKK